MVYIFLADGFEEIEALTQIDYLRRAGVDIISVGITEKDGEEVSGAHGIRVLPDINISEAKLGKELEMIVLPGGLGGVKGMSECEKVKEFIDFCLAEGKFIAAICAAPTILANYGVLDGKCATCYPDMRAELEKRPGCSVGGRVIRDGNIITAAAAGVSEEFSFELISVLKGGEAAGKVWRGICAR